MALDFGKTANAGIRWLKGDNAISDIDEGFRALAEDVDQKTMLFVEDTFAKRPAAGIPNRTFRASDTGALYIDNGKIWQQATVGNGLFSNLGGGGRALELRSVNSTPVAGNAALFPYTETGIAFPTACVEAWVGGFVTYVDAIRATPSPSDLNVFAQPHGKNVEVTFQQPLGSPIYPVIKILALGY